MIAKLKTLPNGTEITTWQLLKLCGFTSDEDDLFGIHAALFDAAKKERITLDMSKHDNKVEGLPFNLDFKVMHN